MAMKRVRGASLIAGGAVLVAWAAAASLPDPPVPQPPAPARSAEARTVASVELQAGQLRARLGGGKPSLKASVRNPFRFGQHPAPTSSRLRLAQPQVPATPVAAPTLVLAGIAEQDTATGAQRTAVISDFARLFLVKEGEAVGDRYRVERIGADAVELRDAASGATVRLGLR
jgi:hypothetical protein